MKGHVRVSAVLAAVALAGLLAGCSLSRTVTVTVTSTAARNTPAVFRLGAPVTLGTFAGTWIGHTRGLVISRRGRAKESIYSGCCDPVLNLTFRLSRLHGTAADATASATVSGVWVRDKTAFTNKYPAPHVGETRTLRLRNGVITETLTGTNYCNNKADEHGTCGA